MQITCENKTLFPKEAAKVESLNFSCKEVVNFFRCVFAKLLIMRGFMA